MSLESEFFEKPLIPSAEPQRPPKRPSALLARSPLFAVMILGLSVWLLIDMWPDVQYFVSPLTAIDLGNPGGYHLDRADANRLVRIAGAPIATVTATDARSGEERRIIALFGTNLVVERPASGPTALYEGRLLPKDRARDYGPFVVALRERGWTVGDNWMVLRDGERPRVAWSKPALTMLVLLIGLINLRALVRKLLR